LAVIAAAGEDPHWYDSRLPGNEAPPGGPAPQVGEDHAGQRFASSTRQTWLPAPSPTKPKPSVNTPGVTGFAVGGYGRRADVPYVDYER
jgi:hypothetical protein